MRPAGVAGEASVYQQPAFHPPPNALAEDQLIESKAKKALNMVSLAKALGGGWQTAYPETPSETAQSTKQSTIN